VDPERDHGRGGRLSVPPGRKLRLGAVFARGLLATLAICAALAGYFRPASSQDENVLDPQFGAVMNSCLPMPKATLAPLPPQMTRQTRKLALADQSEPSAAPSTAPTDAPPTSTPSSPQPTLPPRLPPPPLQPGQLLPPTPIPTGGGVTPPPLPTPTPAGTALPIYLVRPTGTPFLPPVGSSASPRPLPNADGPSPLPQLRPFDMVVMADEVHGFNVMKQPGDASGNVHIFYVDGQIVGDKAHYDGDHTITMTGHTYLIDRSQDSLLYADSIQFDTNTRKSVLLNGRGESIAGVQHGKIHYTAEDLQANSNGTTHGDHASFTTCENPKGGYHVEANTIDITPGDKLIARKAVVFLGPLAILYLPFLVIPLTQTKDPRKQTSFLPIIGYDDAEGYYIKTRLGFAPSDTYYGYYRVEYFTKRGLGLGYTAVIGSKSRKHYLTIDSYTISDHVAEARETNVNIQDSEIFNQRLRGQFGLDYVGDFGPLINLPASYNLTGTLAHQGNASTETFTLTQFKQGDLQSSFNAGFVDTIRLSQNIQQQFNISDSNLANSVQDAGSLHLNSDTHWATKQADFDLVYDKTDFTTTPFGYDRLPELTVVPHFDFHDSIFDPEVQFQVGQYTEPQNQFSTERAEAELNLPVFLKLGTSDFQGTYNIRQDYYGTGDLKAFEMQDLSLTTPIGSNLVNSVTYNEQHPIGPADVPFELLDQLSSGSKSAQDVIRFYNKDVYSLSLAGGTNFDEMAQPVTYQFNARLSPRSLLVVGGYWQPGPGNGFGTTNIQTLTPFGRDTTLQFSTNINWKNKGQLQDKNIYLSKIIGDCYRIDASYNEDYKQFNLNVVILAFPNQNNFGFNGPSSILPQSFGGL
jgi:hypothetical protein